MRSVIGLVFTAIAAGQTPEAISMFAQVKSIYVDQIEGNVSETFRDKLVLELSQSQKFNVTTDPEKADAILTGRGRIWKGEPRMFIYGGMAAANTPTYFDYVVTLVSKDKTLLWGLDAGKKCEMNTSTCTVKQLVKAFDQAKKKARIR